MRALIPGFLMGQEKLLTDIEGDIGFGTEAKSLTGKEVLVVFKAVLGHYEEFFQQDCVSCEDIKNGLIKFEKNMCRFQNFSKMP